MRMLWMAMVVGVLGAQAPDARQALSMARPLDAEISPDGRRVAYVLSRTNWEDNANESDIYVAAVSGGEPVRLTAQRKSASGPVWSPDSKRIALVSNRDGKQQIYVIPVEGGEAMPLTGARDRRERACLGRGVGFTFWRRRKRARCARSRRRSTAKWWWWMSNTR